MASPDEGAPQFPADVLEALRQAGWQPGRDVSTAVDDWLVANTDALDGLILSDAARAVLTEFGALTLEQAGPRGIPKGGFATRLHPQEGPLVTDAVRAFAERTGLTAFPIGVNADGPSDLVLTADGRAFLLHWADDFFVGSSFEETLVWLVRGGEILPVAGDGSY